MAKSKQASAVKKRTASRNNLNILAAQVLRSAKAKGVNLFITVEGKEPGSMNAMASCSRQFMINMIYHVGMNDPDILIEATRLFRAQAEKNMEDAKAAAQQSQPQSNEEGPEGSEQDLGESPEEGGLRDGGENP